MLFSHDLQPAAPLNPWPNRTSCTHPLWPGCLPSGPFIDPVFSHNACSAVVSLGRTTDRIPLAISQSVAFGRVWSIAQTFTPHLTAGVRLGLECFSLVHRSVCSPRRSRRTLMNVTLLDSEVHGVHTEGSRDGRWRKRVPSGSPDCPTNSGGSPPLCRSKLTAAYLAKSQTVGSCNC